MTPPVVSVESPGEFSWALQATVKVHLGERGAHTATAGLWEEYVGAQGTVTFLNSVMSLAAQSWLRDRPVQGTGRQEAGWEPVACNAT